MKIFLFHFPLHGIVVVLIVILMCGVVSCRNHCRHWAPKIKFIIHEIMLWATETISQQYQIFFSFFRIPVVIENKSLAQLIAIRLIIALLEYIKTHPMEAEKTSSPALTRLANHIYQGGKKIETNDKNVPMNNGH